MAFCIFTYVTPTYYIAQQPSLVMSNQVVSITLVIIYTFLCTSGAPYTLKEGKANAVKIKVELFDGAFLIWKNNHILQMEHGGYFMVVNWGDPT